PCVHPSRLSFPTRRSSDLGHAEYFVCDMGSGARAFGEHILARQGERPATVNVFMSHVHWDHIMGFPFFGPAYVPGTRIRIHGCQDRKSTRLNSSHEWISYA